MDVLAAEVPHRDLYTLLIRCVGPRPIAWVSSVSAAGQPNLAPFSFFNCVCGNPPLLAFAPGLRPPNDSAPTHGEPKDTLRNIRETGEFVISVVTYHLRAAMNLTSGEYEPPSTSSSSPDSLPSLPPWFVRRGLGNLR